MRTLRIIALSLSAGAALCLGAGAPARPGPPDARALADTLVNECARVQENDIVLIEGGVKEQELLENIAATVSKRGGFPLLAYGSDRLNRLTYDWTPAKYDARTSTLGLKLADMINVMISVDYNENPALFSDVPPERGAARARAQQAVMQSMLKHSVRFVSLGNELYPTEARAKQLGVSREQLAEVFWAGVKTDPAMLWSTGEQVKQALAAGSEVVITNPNGTRLTCTVNGRTPLVSDGAISPDDQKKGGAACQVWLPAGEVYTTCNPGSAEGKVVFDHFEFQGKDIPGLTLTFSKGRVTGMSAASGLEPLKARYDAAGNGKDALAFIDIGINPDVKLPAGGRAMNWVQAGMVSIGIGNNIWAGGDNASDFDAAGHIPGSTLKVDGKTMVEVGELRR